MDPKQAYLQKIEAQLKEWSARIELLMAKAEHITADARVEYAKRVEHWKAKQAAAQARLAELRQAGGARWQRLKTGVERALEDLKAAFDHHPPSRV